MTVLEKIQRLYECYLEQAHQVEQERNPLDGILGFGTKSADAPCHDQFIKAMEILLNSVAGENLNSNELREVLAYIFQAPKENQKPLAAYWMLIAVHGQTIDLIKNLDREDAGTLWAEYKRMYRHWDRLPAQARVLAALDRARKSK